MQVAGGVDPNAETVRTGTRNPNRYWFPVSDGHLFTIGPNGAEHSGYIPVCEGSDGVINLITSRER